MAGESNQSAARNAAFDADRIRAATFGRHVEIHETIGSTNDRAAELAREPRVELPALIVARRQTAGRGRGQNVWRSAEGSLTFSVLLEPAVLEIGAAHWPRLSLAAAVAVCDALESQSARQFGIKWPNDVYSGGGKICGFLIESPGGLSPAKDRLVIGIGVNVNNSFQQATPDAVPGGAALCDLTGRPHDLEQLLIDLLQALRFRLAQLARNDPSLSRSWQERCLLAGRSIRVEQGAEHIEGACLGIASDGALIIETAKGPRSIYSGSIAAIR